MIRVGITGQSGFIGTNLYNTLGLYPGEFERIPFHDDFFHEDLALRKFVKQCDVIVHLSALNRHSYPKVLYDTNMRLVKQLITSMDAEKVTPFVIFASSIQEERDNAFGKSKRDGRLMLEDWAVRRGASFSGLILPNVYGPFAKPFNNSFVATFSYQLTHGEVPEVHQDSDVKLVYISNLCDLIIQKIRTQARKVVRLVSRYEVSWDFQHKVSEILSLLQQYRELYLKQGIIPEMNCRNDYNLFNTFRSYIDLSSHFPVKLDQHPDLLGMLVETSQMGVGGQLSFFTTLPGATRGNHYHTRSLKRLTVIKGKALVKMRQTGTDEILEFELDGNIPSYVDIPIWHVHNLTNTGEEPLYIQLWKNELYQTDNEDTYYEQV